jgi:HK97 family phage major capsid protein
MANELDALKGELKQAADTVRELVGKQNEEIKSHGATTSATASKLEKAEQRYDAAMKEMDDRLSKLEVKGQHPDYSRAPQAPQTPGQKFANSDELKSAIASRKFESGSVDIGSFWSLKTIANATIGDADAFRAPVVPTFAPELYYDPGQRALTIRDIMNVAPTGSNQIVFYRELDEFNDGSAAAQVQETEVKHQMEMNFELLNAPVVTIAAWLPASRQVLDDRTELQSHIDSRLIYKVNVELEDQVIFGDGIGGNMLGINNTPGVQTIGAPTGTDTAIDHLRRAFARVRVNEYQATAVILHPNDWAEIELAKGSDRHYIWTTVPDGGVPRLWRVPVVESTVMQEGRFLTGAFGMGAQLWDRQQASVRISEHHDRYFIRNAVAILAEVRVGLTVYRPRAFIRGIFDSGLST